MTLRRNNRQPDSRKKSREEISNMLAIASNLTTLNPRVNRIFREAKASGWKLDSSSADMVMQLARQCAEACANVIEIDLQHHHDHPEAMEFAVRAAEQGTDLRLCLSTNNVETLQAGLKACKRLPLVNYVSVDQVRLGEMLPLIARSGASVILLVSDPAAPADAREMLNRAAILIGAANENGIPNSEILVDPGLVHIGSDIGQRHLAEIIEFLRALPEATDPPVGSTCWLSNGSAGTPRRLRPLIESALLPMLAGAGLSSVFLDVLRRENRQTMRLVNIFTNQVVYADGEIGV
ncbi:MAG: dihydropteroate synthase [Chloroflexi bacterium]|nr:dihydropteroate synthase [Chloroflexota bacterium]